MADDIALPRVDLLRDEVIALRPWRPDDADPVFEACQDPAIARFIPIPQPYTRADATDFISRSRESTLTGPSAHLAITAHGSDVAIGAISREGPHGHRASIGYWLHPGQRGRGLATRAVRLVAEWTLETTDVVRLEIYTNPDNLESGGVATRAGFAFEGVRRAWDLDRDGRPLDCPFYVRIRDGA